MEHVLNRFKNTIDENGDANTKGLIIQMLFLVLGYIFVDILTNMNVI